MTIWAIVPVKPLRLGKSRLRETLPDQERAILNERFLEQTLETLRQTPEIAQTLVVSRDPAALAIAREFGARTVLEEGTPNLNAALTRATFIIRNYAKRGVLVLPADLPLLQVQDVQEIVQALPPTPAVVIAPDRHKEGTNGLLVAPGLAITYQFGAGSFANHCQQAREKDISLHVLHNPRLALDLDTPADLELFRAALQKFSH